MAPVSPLGRMESLRRLIALPAQNPERYSAMNSRFRTRSALPSLSNRVLTYLPGPKLVCPSSNSDRTTPVDKSQIPRSFLPCPLSALEITLNGWFLPHPEGADASSGADGPQPLRS